jgi:hypothetical protein
LFITLFSNTKLDSDFSYEDSGAMKMNFKIIRHGFCTNHAKLADTHAIFPENV